MSVVSELLAANKRYATRFKKGALPAPPKHRVAILTCMDARLRPGKFLGLDEGDAHVISNAGGRASPDALRSLAISNKLLGTREVLVIHHTDCGMLNLDSEQLRRDIGSDAPVVDFLGFTDLEGSIRDDVETIRESPLISAKLSIRGFVYDVGTGRLREVS